MGEERTEIEGEAGLRARITDLERKVEYLIQRIDGAGATFTDAPTLDVTPRGTNPLGVSAEVVDLARRGKAVAAVKQLRHETGMSLAAAEHAVDRLS